MEASDDQFSLKWNNFQSNLASGFADLLQEEDMVDVTLACEGKYLQAHKVILSVCSPYFKDLFKANPCKHPIVILKDCGHQELLDMLDFMYRGEASVRQEDLAAFLKLAETLKVKGLAGGDNSQSLPTATPRKAAVVAKKKVKLVETPSFEPDDDPGDPEFTPAGGGGEPKRKRKRLSSPAPKTDSISSSATNNFISITNPKQELQEPEEVEFLDESQNDPLVHYIQQKKQPQTDDEGHDGFDDSNMDAGDDTHDDLDMTAGPSNIEDSTDQVPQAKTNDASSYYLMENQHGLPQLVYNGYVFRRDRERSRSSLNRHGESVERKRSYWRCIVRTCKARGNVDPHKVLRISSIHDHPQNEEMIKYRNLRTEIKRHALNFPSVLPKEILEHFNIKDESLEKTIINWRYRFGKDNISPFTGKVRLPSSIGSGAKVIKEEDDLQSNWRVNFGKDMTGAVYFTDKDENVENMDENLILDDGETEIVFEDDQGVAYEMDDTGAEQVFYILKSKDD